MFCTTTQHLCRPGIIYFTTAWNLHIRFIWCLVLIPLAYAIHLLDIGLYIISVTWSFHGLFITSVIYSLHIGCSISLRLSFVLVLIHSSSIVYWWLSITVLCREVWVHCRIHVLSSIYHFCPLLVILFVLLRDLLFYGLPSHSLKTSGEHETLLQGFSSGRLFTSTCHLETGKNVLKLWSLLSGFSYRLSSSRNQHSFSSRHSPLWQGLWILFSPGAAFPSEPLASGRYSQRGKWMEQFI